MLDARRSKKPKTLRPLYKSIRLNPNLTEPSGAIKPQAAPAIRDPAHIPEASFVPLRGA
ncbi:hypothetical protein [Mizugakiibacter sediminis]|uniref:hypothetical protein n=1 Tax=Mizugakiibacter sediminis TaxID=1475481 RepID=UPI001651A025|nr:hypothetical protein [Mizugakiibacter sediminis]